MRTDYALTDLLSRYGHALPFAMMLISCLHVMPHLLLMPVLIGLQGSWGPLAG